MLAVAVELPADCSPAIPAEARLPSRRASATTYRTALPTTQ
ncbi:hypothetical protein [Streptomyces sp. PVA_94-07]|nr:hypothetical protein [Streptomyces sp. PVA_94-07]